ncbi:MAG: response regulator [Endomicrobia bacterium]|nr:response regulator [Endomicrobiia bacterium]
MTAKKQRIDKKKKKGDFVEGNIKILVIEDEEIVKETLAENLKEQGFAVETAEDAQSALTMIKQFYYDILLVDYRLPDMNGLALIKEAAAISKDSVSIVVTGYSSVETAVDAMRMGAYDYLLKPLDIEALVEEIKVILQERNSFRIGREKLHAQLINELSPINDDDVVIIASKDSLVPTSKEGIFSKIFKMPGLFFKKIIEFYWG